MTQSATLLVDVGNSRIKWNLLPIDADQFGASTQAVSWRPEELKSILDQYWTGIDVTVQSIYIASVAGDHARNTLAEWCDKHWQLKPRFVSTSASFNGIKNGYQDFHELGVDRWLGVIAAHQLYSDRPVIVVDCGTAITVDTLLPGGQHRAGPIIPGRKMALASLAGSTAFASDFADSDTTSTQPFVFNTKDAVLSGVNFATAKAVEAVIEQIQRELSQLGLQQPIVLTTGGAKAEIMPFTSIKNYHEEPDLVLKGLQRVAMGES